MSLLKKYTLDGRKDPEIRDLPTDSKKDEVAREKIDELTLKNQKRIIDLQDRLYADGREGLIIVLQAMDAAGKDSTVRHVLGGINPQGVDVYSFKQPSSEELSHDFLWRANTHLPKRGKIAVFNRSYYEDVLVVQVHQLQKGYALPERIARMSPEKFFKQRYRQIRNYEEYLYENGYRLVKVFLNVSKEKQKERFLERIDLPEKNWKFSSSDLKEREHWDEYQRIYQEVISATATEENPWYVIPADHKWYARYLISEAIARTMKDMDPQYPTLPKSEAARLQECKEILLAEDD